MHYSNTSHFKNTSKANDLVIFYDSKASLEITNKDYSKLTQEIQHQLKEMDKLESVFCSRCLGILASLEINEISSQITFDGVNAIGRFRLKENTTKKDSQVCEISANKDLTKTITRLRAGTGLHRLLNNCYHVPLTPG